MNALQNFGFDLKSKFEIIFVLWFFAYLACIIILFIFFPELQKGCSRNYTVGKNLIFLRCRLRPFSFQNQMIITESIESFNCSSSVFLVVKMNVGESFAHASVFVLGQVHLRLLAEFVREVLQISVGSRFGKIGDANGGSVVPSLSASVLLSVAVEWRNVFSGLG